MLVGGDEWHGGNLSYHLNSRPKWDNILESKKTTFPKNIEGGVLLVGDEGILSKICNEIYYHLNISSTEARGVCMIGKKK